MDASEYIEAVTGQMRCKRARAMVAKELSDHIEDQTDEYLKEGMPLLDAQSEAVRQMGDAVEVGAQMDALHRPRVDRKTLVIIGILSAAACFLQTIVLRAGSDSGELIAGSKMVPFQVLLGVALMVAILYLDYTLLGKHPIILWIGIFSVPLLAQELSIGVGFGRIAYNSQRAAIYAALALAPPVYAALVYHYRTKRWIGMLFSLLWLATGVVLLRKTGNTLLYTVQVGFICLFVLSYAIAKGWYGIRRVPALVILWTGLLGGCIGGVAHIFLHGAAYQQTRLKAYFGFWEPDAYLEIGYVTSNIRNTVGQVSLWGRGGGWMPVNVNGAEFSLSSDMSFYILLNRIGVIPCIFIIFGLLALLVAMAAGVSKQKNVLGGLVGTASIMGLLLPIVSHVLSNLSILPYGSAMIPFLYPGWLANGVFYTLLGFYLSVYRNTDVVA